LKETGIDEQYVSQQNMQHCCKHAASRVLPIAHHVLQWDKENLPLHALQ
jgi:hypothetical protein